MLEALELIGSRHRGETVAAVTHAVMIRLAVLEIENIPGEQWRIPVGRGSLTKLLIDGGRLRLAAMPEGADVD
jgi:broad specificity phosphatase PhoE